MPTTGAFTAKRCGQKRAARDEADQNEKRSDPERAAHVCSLRRATILGALEVDGGSLPSGASASVGEESPGSTGQGGG